MIRDPFYQDIIRGLNGTVDPELFEQCAADLLRTIYPSLVPIRGGTDAGMDGAIGDAKGTAYPLVCTTGEDVIGNLTDNLNSYVQGGGSRRKVVLATPRKLTQTRRSNLEARAQELRFTLVQVHSQEAIADLLYRDPAWCKELLGLTGQPRALSVMPRTSRPQITDSLIGREDDLAWLLNTEGDLLVAGQPGSGKTFLLSGFAKNCGALFLVSDDLPLTAGCIRAQQPKAVIVDDAHLDAELITRLFYLRDEISARFAIIATCWPGQKGSLLQCMQIPTSSVRDLGPLTRDQIVELVKSTGIAGPTELIRELVNQAEGRPGLAATLCHLCIKGDIRQVALGEALARDISTTFETLLGREVGTILAVFSLGGDRGMDMTKVSNYLGLRLVQVRQVVTQLAAGGVLTDVGEDRLCVGPAALRYALVKDVFFSGATRLPIDPLITQSPDVTETTLVLIGSRARGAPVPEALLRAMVEKTSSRKALEAYAHLGQSECLWMLENHPGELPTVADAALDLVPQKAIPLLLSKAIADTSSPGSNPDHPLRQIEDWILSGRRGKSGSAISRRETLLNAALSWFPESGNAHVTLRALSLALSPCFGHSETGPGSALTLTLYRGLLTPAERSIVQGFWPRVKDFLSTTSIDDWKPVSDIMHEWLYPCPQNPNIPNEVRDSMRQFAIEMANDLISTNADRPGLLSLLFRTLKRIDVQPDIELDPKFDILYPMEDWWPDWREIVSQQQSAADELATTWSAEDPETICGLIMYYEREAQIAQITWPRWSPRVCETIAGTVQHPSAWARSLIREGGSHELVVPFLKRAASLGDPEFPKLLRECLEVPNLQSAAFSAGLTAESPPADVLSDILSILDDRFSQLVSVACMRSEIPEKHVAILLEHRICAIAAAAAVGEWHATPEFSVRESLEALWRKAVVTCLENEYESEQIFRRDPSIAFDWLELRIKENRSFSYRGTKMLDAALQLIDLEQRKRLLAEVPGGYWDSEVIAGIVDDDLEAYHHLLQEQRLNAFHLAPLKGNPPGFWIEKALMALDAGYSPKDVSEAVYGDSWFWTGNESDYWEESARSFEPLLAHDDPRIREVGRIGREQALEQKTRALVEERRRDIYGR